MSEWYEVRLKDISTQRKGINYKSSDYCQEGSGHPFFTIKCFIKGGGYEPKGMKFYDGPSVAADHLATDDIIYSVTDLTRNGDIVGSPLKVPELKGQKPPLASMDCMRIEPKSDLCIKDFLYHLMMLPKVRAKMVAYSAGSTVLHLDVKRVPYFKVCIPRDINQQIVLSKILNSIDETIKKTEALIEKYQQIKAGLMHDLFTRGIGADGKLRPPREEAPELYHETAIGWIPREWELDVLKNLASIVSGITLGPTQKPGHNIQVPYLRVANVQDGFLDLSEVKSILVDQKTIDYLQLRVGDVLMNEGGDFDKLGRGTIWQGEIPCCIHQNHVFRVRVIGHQLQPEFLTYHSQSLFGKKYFLRNSKQSTNLASINSTQLKDYPIGLPTIEEQTQILNRVNAVNHRITAIQAEGKKLRLQKTGLMQDLLTGKVQVNILSPEQAAT